MPFPFTGEREEETPWRLSYLAGESEELWGSGGGRGWRGCKMYAVCRVNLFHMTGLGLFLSTALLSSKESGSVTT